MADKPKPSDSRGKQNEVNQADPHGEIDEFAHIVNELPIYGAAELPPGWLRKWPWATFLLPFMIYMVCNALDAKTVDTRDQTEVVAEEEVSASEENISPTAYPKTYTIKIALTLLAMIAVWKGYRTLPFHISPLSIVVGVVGVVLWILICDLHLEEKLCELIGLKSFLAAGDRPAYNPLKSLADHGNWAYAFMAIRFFGLALVVPVVEEFFIRGFVMRVAVQPEWWKLPFGFVTPTAVVVGTVVPMMMHPGELLASAVWFTMITWLMVRTKNIWDCVAAHAVTNFLLGVYVVQYEQWQLW